MKNKKVVLASLFIGLLLTGCATLADARNAKGKGKSHIYNASFDTVWGTVPKAITELHLSIAGDNRQEGYFLVQKGITAFSYGEEVAVFVEKVDDTHTRVEVVSKKAMATNVFAWNWEKPIHNKLEEMLNAQ